MNYIGVSYKWGGESSDEGFDCSGLTMTVYQLNGLDLPRTSRQQWKAGTAVARNELLRGDLVFFATAGGRRVSHVGVYTGENKFIHAPGKSKRIRLTSLSKSYYRSRFVGARRYI
jgi:cell wall-associated NlpC family hydrolase